MPWSRRALLAALAGSAGCTALDPPSTTTAPPDRDDDGVPDHADDFPDDPERASISFESSGTPDLAPGEFNATLLTASSPDDPVVVRYSARVLDDPPATVDCLVFERSAYDAFVDGARDVPIVTAHSRLGVRAVTYSWELTPGTEYLFAFDNTDQGSPATAEPVTVETLLQEIRPPPER